LIAYGLFLGIPAATSTAGQGTMPEPKKHLQIRHRIYETEYLGADLQPNGEFLSSEEAIRLLPDQWPTFAEQAWTSLALAESEMALRAMVDPAELSRVDGDQ
ncbi:MAG: hypothetical protein ACLQU2_27755, partial [Candidatus Binataceae bacterium]